MGKSIKEELISIVSLSGVLPDKEIEGLLLDLIIYKRNKENTLKLFLEIQDRDKKRIKEENQKLYMGIESAMHNFAGVSKYLMEGKNSRKAKEYLKMILSEKNIAYLINICKAYFPNGTSKGASNLGKWFFEQFTNMIKEHGHLYLEGGEDHKWAKRFDHVDYIKLVIENMDEKVV